MSENMKVSESDIRATVAIIAVVGFFLTVSLGLWALFLGALVFNELMILIPYVGTVAGTPIAFYFGAKSEKK